MARYVISAPVVGGTVFVNEGIRGNFYSFHFQMKGREPPQGLLGGMLFLDLEAFLTLCIQLEQGWGQVFTEWEGDYSATTGMTPRIPWASQCCS